MRRRAGEWSSSGSYSMNIPMIRKEKGEWSRLRGRTEPDQESWVGRVNIWSDLCLLLPVNNKHLLEAHKRFMRCSPLFQINPRSGGRLFSRDTYKFVSSSVEYIVQLWPRIQERVEVFPRRRIKPCLLFMKKYRFLLGTPYPNIILLFDWSFRSCNLPGEVARLPVETTRSSTAWQGPLRKWEFG